MRTINSKPVPTRIGIFGSNAHIGREVARELKRRAPAIKLRLFIRLAEYQPMMEKEFPNDEIVEANYFDLTSLESGFDGLQGLFLITKDFIDDSRAMNNVVAAARSVRSLVHIVRLIADPPGMTRDRVPNYLRDFGMGTAVQHLGAKEVLERSGLPITYINIAAYYFQNLTQGFSPSIRAERTLVVPKDRLMAHIDSADVGKCAAALLASDNHRHIGQTYHLNNGHDLMTFSELASLMSDILGETIHFDGSDEGYLRRNKDFLADFVGHPHAADYFLNYFQFEQDNEVIWGLSDIVERLTGQKAKKYADWLLENKEEILAS